MGHFGAVFASTVIACMYCILCILFFFKPKLKVRDFKYFQTHEIFLQLFSCHGIFFALVASLLLGLILFYFIGPDSLSHSSVGAICVFLALFLCILSVIIIRKIGEDFENFSYLYKIPIIALGPSLVGLGLGLELRVHIPLNPIIPDASLVIGGLITGLGLIIGLTTLIFFLCQHERLRKLYDDQQAILLDQEECRSITAQLRREKEIAQFGALWYREVTTILLVGMVSAPKNSPFSYYSPRSWSGRANRMSSPTHSFWSEKQEDSFSNRVPEIVHERYNRTISSPTQSRVDDVDEKDRFASLDESKTGDNFRIRPPSPTSALENLESSKPNQEAFYFERIISNTTSQDGEDKPQSSPLLGPGNRKLTERPRAPSPTRSTIIDSSTTVDDDEDTEKYETTSMPIRTPSSIGSSRTICSLQVHFFQNELFDKRCFKEILEFIDTRRVSYIRVNEDS